MNYRNLQPSLGPQIVHMRAQSSARSSASATHPSQDDTYSFYYSVRVKLFYDPVNSYSAALRDLDRGFPTALVAAIAADTGTPLFITASVSQLNAPGNT